MRILIIIYGGMDPDKCLKLVSNLCLSSESNETCMVEPLVIFKNGALI